MSIDLMDALATIGNFNYVITETNEHGNLLENGKFTGIVGQLADNEADIGLGTLQRLEEREMAIDFTIPYYDSVGFLTILPFPRVSTHMFKFVGVLGTDVWTCTFIGFFLSTYVLIKVDKKQKLSIETHFCLSLALFCMFSIVGVHTATEIIPNYTMMMKTKSKSLQFVRVCGSV